MAEKRLAMNENGELTYCTAPADKIGQGRCNHVDHQGPEESTTEFIERVNLEGQDAQVSPICPALYSEVEPVNGVEIFVEAEDSEADEKFGFVAQDEYGKFGKEFVDGKRILYAYSGPEKNIYSDPRIEELKDYMPNDSILYNANFILEPFQEDDKLPNREKLEEVQKLFLEYDAIIDTSVYWHGDMDPRTSNRVYGEYSAEIEDALEAREERNKKLDE